MWPPYAINLEYIAANIRNDVEAIKIVNQEFDESDINHHLDEFKPDLLGVTMSATEHSAGLELCRIAKRRGIATAIGGYHPTAIPEKMIEYSEVDMVFRGESEFSFKELVTSGSPEGIAGVSFRKDGEVIHNPERTPMEDLDVLPFPARDLRAGDECDRWVKRGGAHRDQIHTSRGCWGKCTFCCEPSMSKSIQRYRRPEKVFEEIKDVYKYHDKQETHVLFGDPHILGNPERTEKLAEMLIDANMKVSFTSMVRADTIASHSKIVAKMVKGGMVAYCMGIESPNPDDLNGTKKGITGEVQKRAVRLLRKNHAVAGGTFVIGLPGQTEEEIKAFPEYARHLGMTNAAFAIATPQIGTEFYEELDSQGLIDVHDWSMYDQMHSVFKHDILTKDQLEKLLTYCIGRFYAPDIFLDDMISIQQRDEKGRKMKLSRVAKYFGDRIGFVKHAGPQYRPEDGPEYGRVFLSAQINPWTRKRTARIGIHNVLEFGPLLRIIGKLKLQIALTNDGVPFMHYVVKIANGKIAYVDVCRKPHRDATLTLKLEPLGMPKRNKLVLSLLSQVLKQKPSIIIKGIVGGLAFFISEIKSNRKPGRMTVPKEYYDTLFLMDGWNGSGKTRAR